MIQLIRRTEKKQGINELIYKTNRFMDVGKKVYGY